MNEEGRTVKQTFSVTGMTCSACSAHVEKAVGRVEGVSAVSVNLLSGSMQVTYDENAVTEEGIIAAVTSSGYGASLPRKAGARAAAPRREDAAAGELRQMKSRMIWSFAFLIPLFYISMGHMMGAPLPGFLLGMENALAFAFTQLLLTLPIMYLNDKYYKVGFKTLFHGAPNMDSLIAVGSIAAVIYGVFAIYQIGWGLGHGDMEVVMNYSHDLYFESAGMILTLITVGKYLEGRSKGKTSEAITKLMDLSPKTAVLLVEGQEVEVPTEELREGDVFLVKPGSLIPVDGTVLEGSSSVDEAAITGESVPVEKGAGDRVVSASMNKAGFLKCRADKVGEDTTLSQIIRLVEEAGASKAPIAQLADKVAGVFVPVVMGIALVTLCAWLLAGAGAEFAISTAIAVLVISCPCALGLATPVAIMVGTGVGAGCGILIKSGEALQQARDVDTVVMDKTGTITAGKLKVTEVSVYAPGIQTDTLVAVAAALEKKSEHPLAEAVVEHAVSLGLTVPEAKDFRAVFGRGVEGVLAGEKYFVGNRPFLEEQGISIETTALEGIAGLADKGMTPLLAAREGEFLGVIGVADQVKASSREAVSSFREMGIHVVMLTGDNARTAEAVRKSLDIPEVVAEVLPQDKEKKIRRLKEEGRRVAMIGDGINDAPALAAAHVGMAIGAGTDVAMESADIVLMKSDLRDAVTAVRLSRAVIRNIKQNLFWAFFYNAIGIPLAAGVWYPVFGVKLNPMFGAAAMSLSSLFVVGNALRLRGFKSGSAGRSRESVESMGGMPQAHAERKKTMTKIVSVEGMMCGHCTGRVQKALEALDGVKSVVMSLEEGTATVELEEGAGGEALKAAVEEAGYKVKGIS